jgi:hypothetical protein
MIKNQENGVAPAFKLNKSGSHGRIRFCSSTTGLPVMVVCASAGLLPPSRRGSISRMSERPAHLRHRSAAMTQLAGRMPEARVRTSARERPLVLPDCPFPWPDRVHAKQTRAPASVSASGRNQVHLTRRPVRFGTVPAMDGFLAVTAYVHVGDLYASLRRRVHPILDAAGDAMPIRCDVRRPTGPKQARERAMIIADPGTAHSRWVCGLRSLRGAQ